VLIRIQFLRCAAAYAGNLRRFFAWIVVAAHFLALATFEVFRRWHLALSLPILFPLGA
jgi:hypothetical protein